jgi:hypothetical protein
MGRSINSGKLTKDYVLSKVSQIKIFSAYLNIPVELIQHCIDSGDFICSPIRDDNHPTCGFRYDNKGRLKFKDFAGYFWGDALDVVALIMSAQYNRDINVNDKTDFISILRHITFTFKDIFYGTDTDMTLINDIQRSLTVLKNKKPIIELVVRQWTKVDEKYWNSFGIDLHSLNTNFIYPIDQYYINRKANPKPKYFYDINDPCYGYNLGRDKSGIDNIKLYFPKRDKDATRFITNCNHLEGIYNLNRKDYDIIIITKSTKDRMALYCHINKMKVLFVDIAKINFGFINIPHETYKLRQLEYDWINNKLCDNGIMFSLMDSDTVGTIQANWLKVAFGITPILIPNRYNSKDFAELKQEITFMDISNLIMKVLKYVRHKRKNYPNTRDIGFGDTVPF